MVEINVPKCALTATMHETGVSVKNDKETRTRMAEHTKHMEETLPVLAANEPYIYLGVVVTADLT